MNTEIKKIILDYLKQHLNKNSLPDLVKDKFNGYYLAGLINIDELIIELQKEIIPLESAVTKINTTYCGIFISTGVMFATSGSVFFFIVGLAFIIIFRKAFTELGLLVREIEQNKILISELELIKLQK